MNPEQTLAHIAARLSEGACAADLIAELLPRSPTGAIPWVRRLPLWDEFRGGYPDRAIAVARLISRQAQRTFDLSISVEGHLLDGRKPPKAEPVLEFPLTIAEQLVTVRHVRAYSPLMDQDSFSFIAEQNPLSSTGFWHQFAPHDVVMALGGPKAFATACAEAKLVGQEAEFMERFEGRPTWLTTPKARKPKAAEPVVGEYTAAVAEERMAEGSPEMPVKQGSLF